MVLHPSNFIKLCWIYWQGSMVLEMQSHERCSDVTDCRQWSGRRGSARLKNCPGFKSKKVAFFKSVFLVKSFFVKRCIVLIAQQSFLLLFQSTFHAFTLILTQKEIKLEEEMILGDKKWILTKSNEKLHNMYFLQQNGLTLMYWHCNSIVPGMFDKY